MAMRTLAIGDIHGCSTALDTLLGVVELQATDTLITLGDYVDRGPDSCGVLERLIDLSRSYHFIPIKGNHDQMMVEAYWHGRGYDEWIRCGGDATLDSYRRFDSIPLAHWRFLEQECIALWETETHFFVHAGVAPDIPLTRQSAGTLLWLRFNDARPHESGKKMVCGHTSQKTGLPLNLDFAVCLDTWAHGGGWLSCLDVDQGRVWQANQSGRSRMFQLEDVAQETFE